MRVVVFHGLFGGWGWECLDERGFAVDESKIHFDSRDECVADARARGYEPDSPPTSVGDAAAADDEPA